MRDVVTGARERPHRGGVPILRLVIILAFLIATFARFAAAQISGSAVEKNMVESTANIASGDIVLTIHGLCAPGSDAPSDGRDDCAVSIGRQQFDDLISIVAPNGPVTPAVKQKIANTYAELLAFALAAKNSGIDQSPQFQNSMEWMRLRALADLYRHNLEKQLSVISEQEIDNYYQQNVRQFEEAKLRRILVPKNNFAIADKREAEKKALEIAMAFRERAARSEDFDQLQKEAYVAAGFNALPPSTEVGNRRRSGLPAEVSEDVFGLEPGDVSKVENEPYSFVIYKIEAKRTLAKERVRDEISREIIKRKREGALHSVTESVHADLNEAYFGAAVEKANADK